LMKTAAFTCAIVLCAGSALAIPPAPTKPVARTFFTGRWYEIARMPNDRQRDCEAPTYEFQPRTNGALAFVLTCHKGSPEGKPASLNVTIRLPADEARNRFRVTALGGLVGVNYWVLDRADDMSWWILATPDNANVWLLARDPAISAPEKARALGRIRAMGYDPARLEMPKQG
jgi:apolipoprotein D and lipocalin family protein